MTDNELRKLAKQRVGARRSVLIHLMVAVAISVFLIVVYFLTGRGYFWPVWPISSLGVAVAIHAAAVHLSLNNFEEDVQKEFQKLKAANNNEFPTDHTSREN